MLLPGLVMIPLSQQSALFSLRIAADDFIDLIDLMFLDKQGCSFAREFLRILLREFTFG
jgi:hypothetical protein